MNKKNTIPRFKVEKHTDHNFYAFRVCDLWTHETYGYGLLVADAFALAIDLDRDLIR